MSGFFWHMMGHLAVALAVSSFAYSKTKNKGIFLAGLLFSFVIDADHLVDYFAAWGFRFNLMRFLEAEYFKLNTGTYVPLHAWELGIAAFSLSFLPIFRKAGWYLRVAGLAWFGHLLWDVFSYRIALLDYFLIWRAAHDFKMKCGL